jgi:hypothetical protein
MLAPSPLIIKLKIWEKIKRTLTRDRINLLMELTNTKPRNQPIARNGTKTNL